MDTDRYKQKGSDVDSEEEPAASQRPPEASRGEERGLGQTLPHCSQEEPTLLTPWSQTSSLKNCEIVNFHCLSKPICGTLLRQLQKVKTCV